MSYFEFCPLLKRKCLKERCTLYIIEADDCSLNCILFALTAIAHELNKLNENTKTQNNNMN